MGILSFFSRRAREERALPPPKPRSSKIRAGVAFGAGGTRGYAHIGVIRAFEENGIDFQYVSGCSAGSIAAAMYAYGMSAAEIEQCFLGLRYNEIKTSKFWFVPSSSKNVENIIRRHIGDVTFENLPKPLAVIGVDLKSGEEIILNYGDVARACSASCAVPGVFSPVEIGELRLIDGGMSNPVPSDILRVMGAQAVVSIDIHSGRGGGTESTKMIDVLKASFEIGMKATALKGIINSDIIIQPDCHMYKQTKLEHMEEMIAEGYRAAMEKMEEIKVLLGMEKPKAEPKYRDLGQIIKFSAEAEETPENQSEPSDSEGEALPALPQGAGGEDGSQAAGRQRFFKKQGKR